MRLVQKLPITKKSQFLSYPHKTLWKWLQREMNIFTKFYVDMTKNVDFLLMEYYWIGPTFFVPDFT